MNNDSFESMLEESFAADAGVAPGQKIEATVVSIGKEYVFLDLGTRAEGMMMLEEVERDGEVDVAEGDRITVFTAGAKDGAVICRRTVGGGTMERTDDKAMLLEQIREAHDAGMPVEGTVKEVNKGGFSVSVMGVRAFCPISQIARGYCENPAEHLERTYSFAVIKFEEGGRNVVLSRRQIQEREAEEAAAQAWETLTEGQVYEGTVTSLQKYGAFVDIGGIEGLVHVSEISHKRVGHPDEVLSEGQAVKVQIKELDHGSHKISLSLKSLLEDPWREALASLTAGRVVVGKVTRLAAFGAFVEVEDGVEGLVHVSRMSETRRVSNPREMVSQGDEVRVRVLEIDPESRRISLELVDENAEEEREITESFRASKKAQGRGGMGTLGDLLSSSLNKKK